MHDVHFMALPHCNFVFANHFSTVVVQSFIEVHIVALLH